MNVCCYFGLYRIIIFMTFVVIVSIAILLTDFGPYGIFTKVSVVTVGRDNAGKSLWALRDNIYDYVCLLF
jgi:hypothetical protein